MYKVCRECCCFSAVRSIQENINQCLPEDLLFKRMKFMRPRPESCLVKENKISAIESCQSVARRENICTCRLASNVSAATFEKF